MAPRSGQNRRAVRKAELRNSGDGRELYSGLIRLHILHHAAAEGIFGLGMIEELARHGYKISPGMLYPLLHGLERKGFLRSSEQIAGGKIRRVYRATSEGRKALKLAKHRVQELFGELFEKERKVGNSVTRRSRARNKTRQRSELLAIAS
jgi:PadR family transcriptional regulator, regulatory protein PadR